MTAHQTYRYFRQFLDDAFPLYEDEELFKGIQRFLLRMHRNFCYGYTSFPVEERNAKHDLACTVSTSRSQTRSRIETMDQNDKGKPIEPVQAFLRHVKQTDGQALLFVPRVPDVPKMVEWLAKV